MFWEQENLADDLIDQFVLIDSQDVDKINLEELIDKIPNLINQYDVGNEKIVKILKRKDILENLIRNVTELPPEHLNENERFKYANTSCCLFLSKNNTIEEEIIKNNDLLDKLLDFLQTDDHNLNPLMTSFFSNTLFSLYTKFNLEMINYFNDNKLDLFDQLFKHINVSAILDLLIKLITLESIDTKRTADIYKWLNKQNIIQKIVDLFKSNIDLNCLENAANLLIHLIERGRQSILHLEDEIEFYQFIYSEHIINELINTIDNQKKSSIHILRILIQFVDYEYHFKLISDIKTKLLTVAGELIDRPLHLLDAINTSTLSSTYEYLISIKNIHRIILINLDKLKQLLIESVPDYSIKTSFGLIEKPLGFVRLEIIHLIYALLNANNPEMNQAIADAKLIEIIINLFFEYEFNSFLHNHVNNIIITLFLNANDNRFKLYTNKDKKDQFLKLDNEKLKEFNFIELVNYAWSDRDCHQHIFKLIDKLDDDEQVMDKFKNDINQLYFSTPKLRYESLISQLFIDCNLVERIMKTYKLLIDRIPVPTFKSNLIEFADIIDKFLTDYKEEIIDKQFLNDELKNEWIDFKATTLDQMKNKIIDVENNFKNEENARLSFREFNKQNRCKRVETPFNILKQVYNNNFEFGLNPFCTQFDRDLNSLNFNLNPDLSNLDHDLFFKKIGYQDKNLIKIDDQVYDDDEPNLQTNLINEQNTTDLKLETTTKDNNEQSTSNNSSLISNSFKDNLFNPLASSSNISNELNIEMDVNISKDDDDILNSKNIVNDNLEDKKDNE